MNHSKYIHIILAIILVSILTSHSHSLGSEAESWSFDFSMSTDKNMVPLKNPQTLFIDSGSERYYIIDSGNNRLLSFDKKGEPLHTFDANGNFENPISMVKKGKSSLYVLEKGKGSITRVNLKNREVKPIIPTYNKKKLYPHRIKQSESISIILDKVSGALFKINDDTRYDILI